MSIKILLIKRNKKFSPNSIEKDEAVICELRNKLSQVYANVFMCEEDCLDTNFKADVYISMGRMSETLNYLKLQESRDAITINKANAVEKAGNRSICNECFELENIAIPKKTSRKSLWVKNNNAWSQTKNDVLFIECANNLDDITEELDINKNKKYITQEHIEGDLVKFYGVANTNFFYTFYPEVCEHSKFGNEKRNGKPHFYKYDEEELKGIADKCAEIIGLDIYGGDCIITPKGEIFVIDFNDFPSFSPCRNEAIDAICEMVDKKIKSRRNK